MSGSRTKKLRAVLTVVLGRPPSKSEFRRFKHDYKREYR